MKIVKMVLESGGGWWNLTEGESRQKVTLEASGRVKIHRHWENPRDEKGHIKLTEKFWIAPEKAMDLLAKIAEHYGSPSGAPEVTDVGNWELTLTHGDGEEKRVSGFLLSRGEEEAEFNEALRKDLDRPNLYLFDGQQAYSLFNYLPYLQPAEGSSAEEEAD